ncbi:GNAT family N-acetyltransferase [Aestuariivivens sediminis]|uniref:GNAT family N-acetyltransferase n=1 Tax=Aestuariivivens sediminis TaxID=2913557 RepID=UPI001F572A11|nr:GNAT family N-acetyltransferase [Aestuariivivens sediminis]
MRLKIKEFDGLTLRELYEILRLRFNVFILDQNSIYNEYDQLDYRATHIFIEEQKEIIAYLRVYRRTIHEVCFGRVAVHPDHRGKKLGRKIIEKCIEMVKSRWKAQYIVIAAQDYLKSFYESFGFIKSSEVFNDGGVFHINMTLKI